MNSIPGPDLDKASATPFVDRAEQVEVPSGPGCPEQAAIMQLGFESHPGSHGRITIASHRFLAATRSYFDVDWMTSICGNTLSNAFRPSLPFRTSRRTTPSSLKSPWTLCR